MVISRPRKDTWHIINLYWLVVWNHGILWPSISWEFHNPNWRTPSFFRGVGRKTTNQPLYSHRNVERTSYQWPFQDPKLEVPTIYKAYIRPMKGNIPTNFGLIWYSTSILGSWYSQCLSWRSCLSGGSCTQLGIADGQCRSYQRLGGDKFLAGESGESSNRGLTRPGKHTKNDGKSPCFMGKSTINCHFQ